MNTAAIETSERMAERNIASLMQRNVTTVGVDDSIDRVEETLDRHHLTCVPVLDAEGGCFGMISSPDLLHFHLLHRNGKNAHAWEICSHKVLSVSADASIKSVAGLMLDKHIHHVVVMGSGSIMGMVSSFDIVGEYYLH